MQPGFLYSVGQVDAVDQVDLEALFKHIVLLAVSNLLA